MMACIQDRAAKGVAHYLDLEEEVCEMHDTDKLGQVYPRLLLWQRLRPAPPCCP